MSGDQLLRVELIDGRLVISIGVGLLAFAVQATGASGWPHGFYINDPEIFAAGIVTALKQEAEDGTTPVHRILDAAAVEALEMGEEGAEEGDVEQGIQIAQSYMDNNRSPTPPDSAPAAVLLATMDDLLSRQDLTFAECSLAEEWCEAMKQARDYIRVLSRTPMPDAEVTEAMDRLFGRQNGPEELSVRNLCYSVFMRAKGSNDEDGGPTDWFTDTVPMVDKGITQLRERLAAALFHPSSKETSRD